MPQAVYILGSEDTGLSDAIVHACHRHVSLPSERYDSYNVAAAGTVIMYDRFSKERRAANGRRHGKGAMPRRGTLFFCAPTTSVWPRIRVRGLAEGTKTPTMQEQTAATDICPRLQHLTTCVAAGVGQST